MRLPFFLLPFLLVGCDSSGPVGLVDAENGVRAEVTSRGIEVENTKGEPIYARAYGELALARGEDTPQTLSNPGRGIDRDAVTMFTFGDGSVRASDDYYRVDWITIKGEDGDLYIGERGTLELAR